MQLLEPHAAAIGGLMIGLAAAGFVLMLGRIAGVSGLLATSARLSTAGPAWGIATAFIVGLPLGAALVSALAGRPDIVVTTSVPLLVSGGLLVGFGTRLGSGCTSGHGVCGIARLSPRSLAATLTFMATGAATVFVIRRVIGG
jgi:uncharacterized protein